MLTQTEWDKLLMIPGPTPVHREILDALSAPTISHTSAPMADIILRTLDCLRGVVGTERGHVFVFSGSGTLAQEAAIVNLAGPGDRMLVVSNGYFGDRFAEIGQAHGVDVDRVAAPWGTSVGPDELDSHLASRPARVVTLTHVDTSTGVLAPVRELAAVAREHGALVVVDTVCSLGGIPVLMDERGIDVVISGAQKALGVPPGLAILAASDRAMERRRTLSRVEAYYADLLRWEATMADPQVYFSTHAVNLFYALRKAMDIIIHEGLDARFDRHHVLGRAFREGSSALGFTSLADEPYAAPTMSVLAYPRGVDDGAFRLGLSGRGVVAAACLGEFRSRGVRFGHMGNISSTEVLHALGSMGATLVEMGVDVDPGAGASAALRALTPVPAL